MEGGVGLLEEVMAVLQQQIKLNISSAIMLSIHSEGTELCNLKTSHSLFCLQSCSRLLKKL